MLSLTSIVDVRVNAARSADTGTGFSTGLILAPGSGTSVTDEQRLRTYVSAGDMLADVSGDFTASSPAYLAAKSYFEANPAPDRVYVSLYPSNRNPADGLDAVLDRANDFYGIYTTETNAAKILTLAAHVAELKIHAVLFCTGTGTVAEATGSNGILKRMHDLETARVCTIYGADAYAGAALMGTAMGLTRNFGDAPFALCYKRIGGMQPVTLTESEIASIKELNANVYITRGLNRRLIENGTVANGLRYDEVLFMDRIAAELQEAALALLTGNTGRLAQTDETSAAFINRFSAILAEYAGRDVLATGPWRGELVGRIAPGDVIENGYMLWAEPYDTQSDADRAAHKAMPIHVALCLAGSVESLVINIDVTM